jgi:hypothetical protein
MEPWVWAVIVPVAIALVGTIYGLLRKAPERIEERLDDHIKEDVRVHERTAVNESEIARIKRDIGDRDSGIRREQHEHAQTLTHHEVRITMLEKK